MADTDTIGALLSAANTFLTAAPRNLPVTSIAWENKNFDPAGKPLWAKVFFVPNTPAVSTLGAGGRDRGTGFVQIDLNIPQGEGDQVFRAWEDYARAFFVAGKSFTRGSQTAVVVSCGMSQGRTVDNWFRKSITVAYRSDFIRQT